MVSVTSLVAFYLVNPFLLMSFVVLRAAGHAAILIDTNVMTKHTFGLQNFGTLVGVYTALVSLGFAIGPWAMGRLFEVYGNYHAAFVLFAVLPLIGAIKGINLIVALIIAIIKAALVVLIFMNVKGSTKLTWLWAALGFIWLLILAGIFMDYQTRIWEPIPGWQ